MKKKVKIGLALGSGAARGLAHIGVLQVLEENGIVPDYIAGSSIGAIVGALYAAGISPKMMEGIAQNLDIKKYYDVTVPRCGFVKGQRIEELLRLLTRDRDFKELNIPLTVTAVDLKTCRLIELNEGKVYKAVRASISIPGIFTPVEHGDYILVDGGLLARVPVDTVKRMGADVVIGVDVGFRGQHRPPLNIMEVIIQSFEVVELEVLKSNVEKGDVIIYPDVQDVHPFYFDKVDECVQKGRQATLEVLGRIKDLIEAHQH
ncbi:NTE family protein [Caldicoprobacter guelmensis]|uniref:patatin-like phospholipase family protein n=1 Tax=Caldicoprobacter guelmensis TaxID=1170224 RepID=UPI0019591D97|nr:patatin-like phospholipase family protein [Caldicoprobacter guelmensis]MBM7581915.1 NTE family protein [Caldicoprobacter guelmensis]